MLNPDLCWSLENSRKPELIRRFIEDFIPRFEVKALMWVAANTSIANRSKGHEGISASVQWSNPLAAAAHASPQRNAGRPIGPLASS